MGERFPAHGDLCREQRDEAEHGHPSIQLFSAVVETPALLTLHHFPAGFSGKGVETPALFCGDSGATDHG